MVAGDRTLQEQQDYLHPQVCVRGAGCWEGQETGVVCLYVHYDLNEDIRCLVIAICLIPLRQIFLNLELIVLLAWLAASNPNDSSCLCHPTVP